MLVFLRKGAQTWVAKLLLLLLVVSFGVWGISSSLMSDNSDTVITVGDRKISASQFRFAYQRQIAELSRQFGTQLTTEQARAFGVESQVYAQLAAGAALDQLSSDMNLGLSQDRLAGLIAEDPAFQGPTGQFDRQLFSSRLRNSGLNENDYIHERSAVAVRTQIVEATSDGFKAPQVLVDALRKYSNESRAVDYLLLTNSNIDPVPAPTAEQLSTWFDSVKSRYRAPEYRSVTYVKLEPADIADPEAISEEAIRQDYEARKTRYEIPGTRTLEQLTFENREMADAAAAELASGTPFDQLVTDQGKTAADVLLGEFTKDRIPDPAIADAAFAVTAEGATTPVVEGAFGPVILRVTNIKEDYTRTFEEVKDEIRSELATAAAVQDILNVHDRFEDLRASGATLEETARELKLKTVSVEKIDSRGMDAAGRDVDLPEGARLLDAIFQTEIGVEALPINIGNDGSVWFEVTDVEPARDRALEEVRDSAIADWTAEQQRTALGAAAENLRARLTRGDTLAAIAEELGIAVESKSGIRRGSDDAVLGPAGVAAAFQGPVGTAGAAPGKDADTQIVLKVTEVNDDATTSVLAGDDARITAIANAAGDDILDQMVNQLQADYGVRINRVLAEQAMVR